MTNLTHLPAMTEVIRARLARWREPAEFIRDVVHRFGEDNLTLSAAALAFFTIISLIPLALFAVMVASYFISPDEIDQQMRWISPQLPQALGNALAEQVRYFIAHRNLLATVALLAGLWSGSAVFLHLDIAINQVWRTRKSRGFWKRRLLAFLMVVLVGTLMFCAATLTNVLRVLDLFQVSLWGYRVEQISWLFTTLISVVVPIVLMSSLFAAIYCILPVRTVTLRSVLPGAVAAGVCWSISLHIFTIYASRFANYQLVYGSLGGTVLMLFWLYFSALVMLLGAEASAVYHQRLLRAGDPDERKIELDDPSLPALDEPDLL